MTLVRERTRLRSSRLPGIEPLALLPLGIGLTVMAPLVFVFIAAFSSGVPGDPTAEFTFATITSTYTEEATLQALGNSLVLAFLTSVLSLVVGTGLALSLVNTDLPGRRWFSILVILPFYLPQLIVAMGWVALGAPRAGSVNVIARALGSARDVVDFYSFPGIVIVMVLGFAPLSYLLISAGMQSLSRTLEEASAMSRATAWQTLRYIRLPLLVPAALAAFIQVAVFAAESFAVPFYLGIGSGYEVVASRIYIAMSRYPTDFNGAAATGTLLIAFALIGIYSSHRVTRRVNSYATVSGQFVGAASRRLGRFRTPALAFVTIYFGMAIVLPLVALFWGSFQPYIGLEVNLSSLTLRHWSAMLSDREFSAAITNTVIVALAGATTALVICLGVSFVSLRTKTFGRGGLDYLASMPTAMPGIVVGLGFLWLYVRAPVPLYGTLLGLGIAYIIRFMGHGVRMTSAGLVQLHTDVTDAARMSGASNVRAIRDIVVPLLRPALVGAWIVLFSLFAVELSMTVLLYGPTTQTLSIAIWSRLESQGQNSVYPLTLLQAGLVFIVTTTALRFGTLRVRTRGVEAGAT